jgi:hypothetical protein
MIEIKLSNSGRFFSGRSHAVELVEKYCPQSLTNEAVKLDFLGVESFTQSFISELFVNLKKRGLTFSNISILGISDPSLSQRAQKELERIRNLNL